MTDNEIRKALECCSYGSEFKCQECPANDYSLSCGSKLAKQALDLINRQKAEIEHFRKVTKKIKSDLKYYLDTNEEKGVVWIPEFTVDTIVKELTEVSDNA